VRTRINRRATMAAALCAVAIGWLASPAAAGAHALSARADLPIPAWLFAWGASLVLIVSFAALSVAWHRARFEQEDWRPVSAWVSGLIVNPVTKFLAALVGALLLILTVATALNGTEAPDRNFSLTFVFVTVWLGGVLVSVLFGDFFRAFNPWAAIARAPGLVFRLIAGQSAQAPLHYPERLGRWPALGGLIGFGWIELVYSQTGFQAVGLVPHAVGIAILVYSAWTLLAMALFGVDVWLERGETFSVYFGMFSQLSRVEVREGRLGIRRAFAAATRWAVVPGSVALVLTTIGITAFDGAQEGLLQTPILDTTNKLIDAGLGPLFAHRLTESFYLAGMIGLVAGVYWLGILGMHSVRGSLPTVELGRRFGHSFIPIALAYLTAHYFSLFVFQEQAQFTYILSDPFGTGHDYFGTASGAIDYGLIGARAIWYVQVAALVAGHVTALVLAHDRAITVYGDPQAATRSQYWMLALMVCFTTLGLFLLSQANG
jgi:hypothetical protein